MPRGEVAAKRCISLPRSLVVRIAAKARREGVSFSEALRRLLEK
jgi:hypothetical protein